MKCASGIKQLGSNKHEESCNGAARQLTAGLLRFFFWLLSLSYLLQMNGYSLQATQKRKAASSSAQAANIRPMTHAAACCSNIHAAASRKEKKKPIRAAKIFGAASTKTGLALRRTRIFLLTRAKRLYFGCQKLRMQKSAATIRMSHFHGLKRKSSSRATVCTALSLPTFSSIFSKDTGHIAFMTDLR